MKPASPVHNVEATRLGHIYFEFKKLKISNEILMLWKLVHTDSVRKYHNWEHIERVLAYIDLLILHETHVAVDEIKMAALFHDFFHSTNFSNDVLQSAEMAYIVARSVGFHEAACCRIRDLVLSTDMHEPHTVDQRILCDSDLYILSDDWEKYSEYKNNIREEYQLIPDDVFYSGRKNILEGLLKHSSIYHTDYGKANWELRARENISREISEIEKVFSEKKYDLQVRS